MYFAQLFDHCALAPLNGSHIDVHRFGLQAKFQPAPRQRDDLGGPDHVLARQACDVGARTAEQSTLDDGGSTTGSPVHAMNLPAIPLPIIRSSYFSTLPI